MFSELTQYGARVQELQVAAYAENTRATLLTYANKYRLFCLTHGTTPFPVGYQVLEAYIAFLLLDLRSSESIKNYISRLKTLHKIASFDTQVFDHPAIQLMQRGLRRLMAHVMRQAALITPEILKKIAAVVDRSQQEQVVVYTALLLGFYLFLR